ncbi:Aldo keto reductase [Lecanosticta acicola]|uniref:Aldo keto reductase n=1 Tax=Lecanosticta acicola TaxID=111012 RepID=A0AAI8YYY1_9PEZI|nr:Aldo keto reductase [Lecanosticta acicola]
MASLTINSTFALKTGHKLPRLGFGVWDSPQNLTVQSCLSALQSGYRHIDTAQVYGNEAEVGEAVRKSGIPRKDVFITSKIVSPESDAAATYQKCLQSVKTIDGENGYLDLLLIHNVTPGAAGIQMMWQAMEKLYEEGKCKSIGVSNMGIGYMEDMKKYAKIWPPHVEQIELHPWCQQREIVDYCDKQGIAVEAYCPLVRNQKADDATLKSIAEKYGKSTAQVLVRYCLDKGWIPLPKSDNPDRIKQNASVYDFALDKGDISQLDAKDEGSKGALVVAVDNEKRS